MRAASDFRIFLVTAGSKDNATAIAQALVTARLAACVNIVPGIQSIYRWEGKIAQESEWLLIIKSRKELSGELEEAITKTHSYDVPEIVSLELDEGAGPYLDWLQENTEKVRS